MKNIFPSAEKHRRLSEMTREDWLAARREGIGGSDAAAILGMSPYESAYDVWLDKTGRTESKEVSLPMMLGQELEETVARLWAAESSKRVMRSGFMYRSCDHKWMLANVDRVVVGENAGLECKTTSSLTNIRRLKSGDFPDTYYAQCVHYMAVTGADRWYLAILELGCSPKFHMFTLDRDQEEIALLIENEREFWENHVLTGTAPAPSGTDNTDDYIKEQYPQAETDEPVGLYGMETDMRRYQELKSEIKALEREVKEIEQKLKLSLGDASKGIAQGYTVTWGNYSRAGGYDTDKLADEFPEAAAACRKPDTTYRRFNIKEDK